MEVLPLRLTCKFHACWCGMSEIEYQQTTLIIDPGLIGLDQRDRESASTFSLDRHTDPVQGDRFDASNPDGCPRLYSMNGDD
jgi:hypothetical protein